VNVEPLAVNGLDTSDTTNASARRGADLNPKNVTTVRANIDHCLGWCSTSSMTRRWMSSWPVPPGSSEPTASSMPHARFILTSSYQVPATNIWQTGGGRCVRALLWDPTAKAGKRFEGSFTLSHAGETGCNLLSRQHLGSKKAMLYTLTSRKSARRSDQERVPAAFERLAGAKRGSKTIVSVAGRGICVEPTCPAARSHMSPDRW
jgi:hypothetical protein